MKKVTRLGIIDADGLAYIIGWNHQETVDAVDVTNNVDEFVQSIFVANELVNYVGIVSYPPYFEQVEGQNNFREQIAKTKAYKGNRKEKPEWYVKWERVIVEHLVNVWGFYYAPQNLETDDVVSALFHSYQKLNPDIGVVLIGNDKDLLQMSGEHYNYKKGIGDFITPNQAAYKLWNQIICGDSTDNIPGIPGVGEKGAEKILMADGVSSENYAIAVLWAYMQKLGEDAGIQAYYENYMLCKMRLDIDISPYITKPFNLSEARLRIAFGNDVDTSTSNPTFDA